MSSQRVLQFISAQHKCISFYQLKNGKKLVLFCILILGKKNLFFPSFQLKSSNQLVDVDNAVAAVVGKCRSNSYCLLRE